LPKFVATDYKISIGTANFSSLLAAATLEFTAEEQDVTSFGETYRTKIAGLKDGSISLDFMQDFGAGSVDATLFPLLGSAVGITITPTSGTVTASNPSYSGTAIVTAYSPFASTVGDLATLSVSWPTSGVWTRATA
jgi:hypothetical protein